MQLVSAGSDEELRAGAAGIFDPLTTLRARLRCGRVQSSSVSSLLVAIDDLAVAVERAEHRSTWGGADQRGAVAFPWLFSDGSSELLMLRDVSARIVVFGDASEGFDDEGEDEPDGEGADDDENQAGEHL